MDKKNQLIILIGALVSLLIVPAGVALVMQRVNTSTNAPQTLTNTPAERTANDMTLAIEKADSGLKDGSGKPTFSLLGFKRLSGNWYVAWIDTKNTKVLINDPSVSASYMSPLMGPGINFSESEAVSKGIPVTIFKAFTNATL